MAAPLLGPRTALLLAAVEGALVNTLLLPAVPSWRAALLLRLFDAAHFLALGGLGVVLFSAWQRVGPAGARWRWPALTVLALLLAAPTLPQDFEHFAERQEWGVSSLLVIIGGTIAVALAIPLAHAAGALLAARGLRLLGLVAAFAALAANGLLLPGDYEGIHLFVALSALTLAASVQVGSRYAPRLLPLRGLAQRFGPRAAAALCVLAALSLLVSEPAATATAHRRASGSVLVPVLGRSKASLSAHFPSVFAGGSAALADDMRKNPWFCDRSQLPSLPPSGPRLLGPNSVVLLITVDALRADVINSRRYDAQLPTFAKLREGAHWFSQARAAGTLTKVSLTSLFMGTYFSQQHWENNASPDKRPRFPEFLQQAGVRTVNYRSIYWLRHGGGTVHGFDEDTYVGKKKQRKYLPSKLVFEQLLPYLEKLPESPHFIFSHLSDPHAPYDSADKDGSAFERYLAEVALVDGQLAKLVELLEHSALGQRTLLIVSADHGEAFGEHEARTHGTTLYDEALRIPLLFWTAAGSGREIGEPVSLIDLGPTILDAFAEPVPGFMMGQSLLPYLRGESPRLSRPIVAETRLMQSWLTENGLKLIVDNRKNTTELYDLKLDPSELTNLADDQTRAARPLQLLRAFFDVQRLRLPGYEPPFVR